MMYLPYVLSLIGYNYVFQKEDIKNDMKIWQMNFTECVENFKYSAPIFTYDNNYFGYLKGDKCDFFNMFSIDNRKHMNTLANSVEGFIKEALPDNMAAINNFAPIVKGLTFVFETHTNVQEQFVFVENYISNTIERLSNDENMRTLLTDILKLDMHFLTLSNYNDALVSSLYAYTQGNEAYPIQKSLYWHYFYGICKCNQHGEDLKCNEKGVNSKDVELSKILHYKTDTLPEIEGESGIIDWSADIYKSLEVINYCDQYYNYELDNSVCHLFERHIEGYSDL